MKLLLIISMLSLACGAEHKPKNAPASPAALELKARRSSWLLELKANSGLKTGWPRAQDCDQTLWAGEAKAGGAELDLDLAEYAAGEIHRRPLVLGECYPAESATTVSRDMLAGYMLGSFSGKDLGALQRLSAYGATHKWVMGVGDQRVVMTPPGQGLLARAIAKLSGDKLPGAFPAVCLPVGADYEKHLQTLSILMEGDISGGISPLCLWILKDNAKSSLGDALFQAALGAYTGSQDKATSLLLDDSYQCPSYVRPAFSYCLVHKLYAATVALRGQL